MSMLKEIPGSLKEMESFTRQEFVRMMISDYGMTEPQVAYDLKRRLEQGILRKYSHPAKYNGLL